VSGLTVIPQGFAQGNSPGPDRVLILLGARTFDGNDRHPAATAREGGSGAGAPVNQVGACSRSPSRHTLALSRPAGLAELPGERHAGTVSGREKVSGHVFISYVREDAGRVDQLQRSFQAAGIPVWRDTADLWPGQDWRTQIRRAITDNALVFIACFSRAGVARGKSYQNEELNLAIEQLRLRHQDDPWFIPVRFDESPIPDWNIGGGRTMGTIQGADLFGNRAKENGDRLVASVLRILGRDMERPADADSPSSAQNPTVPGKGTINSDISSRLRDLREAGSKYSLRFAVGHSERVNSVAFNHDGAILATADIDANIFLWDVATGRKTAVLRGHEKSSFYSGICSVAFNPRGTIIASGGGDRTVRLWDLATCRNISTFTGHTGVPPASHVRSVAFSPNGHTLGSSGDDRTIRLWDAAAGRNFAVLKGHRMRFPGLDGVFSLAFSPDGATIASGGGDGKVRLWDVETRRNFATLVSHTSFAAFGVVYSVAFSPDGATVAGGGGDGKVRLWDVETRRKFATLGGPRRGQIHTVAFSPDSTTVASGGWDTRVHLWSVATGQKIADLPTHGGIDSVAFSPDGFTLASGGGNGAVHLWGI
jgi:WD40 repeat protein